MFMHLAAHALKIVQCPANRFHVSDLLSYVIYCIRGCYGISAAINTYTGYLLQS